MNFLNDFWYDSFRNTLRDQITWFLLSAPGWIQHPIQKEEKKIRKTRKNHSYRKKVNFL